MPVGYEASISFKDKADSTSTTSLNFDSTAAIAYSTDQTGAMNNWFSAVAAVSKATRTRSSGGAGETPVNPALPTADDAYNSAKLTVFYHDTVTGKSYRYSIPARDISKFNTYPNSKNVILTIALGGTQEIETLVTTTQAGKSPDGNSISVDQIVIAGGKQS